MRAATAVKTSTADKYMVHLAVLRSPIKQFTEVDLVSVPIKNSRTTAGLTFDASGHSSLIDCAPQSRSMEPVF